MSVAIVVTARVAGLGVVGSLGRILPAASVLSAVCLLSALPSGTGAERPPVEAEAGAAGAPAGSGAPAATEASEGTRIALSLPVGRTVGLVVEKEQSSEVESGMGKLTGEDRSLVEYRVRLLERKENGDLTLAVTYGRVTIRTRRNDDAWDYDRGDRDRGDRDPGDRDRRGTAERAEPAADDADCAESSYLQAALASTITVRVARGRIAEVAGFPEVRPQPWWRGGRRDGGDARDPRDARGGRGGRDGRDGARREGDPEAGPRDRGGPPARGAERPRWEEFRGLRTVGRGALQGDLEWALALPVQGRTVEVGKAVPILPPWVDPRGGTGMGGGPRGPGPGPEAGGRGRGPEVRGPSQPVLAYVFEGEGVEDGLAVARFRLEWFRPDGASSGAGEGAGAEGRPAEGGPPELRPASGRPGEGRQGGARQAEGRQAPIPEFSGTTSVSLEDGLVVRLAMRSEAGAAGEGGDRRPFRWSHRSTTTIRRLEPAEAPEKAPGEGSE